MEVNETIADSSSSSRKVPASGKDNVENEISSDQQMTFSKSDSLNICEVCGKQFNSLRAVTAHKLWGHKKKEKEKQKKCDVCQGIFPNSKSLKYHIRHVHKTRSDGSEKTCKLCNETFPDAYTFRKHILLQHNTCMNQCPHCDKLYFRNYDLRKHIRKVHNPQTSNETLGENRSLLTSKCSKVSDENETGTPGFLATENRSISDKDNKMSASSLKKKMTCSELDFDLDCDICGKHFQDFANLQLHTTRVHEKNSDGSTHTCKICLETFPDKYTIRQHTLTQHRKTCTYECPYCDKAYLDAYGLRRHIQTIHKHSEVHQTSTVGSTDTQDRPVTETNEVEKDNSINQQKINTKSGESNETDNSCDICGKVFDKLRSLNAHKIAAHKYDRFPRQCDICNRTFRFPSGLQRHILYVHQKKSNGNTETCKICTETFPDAFTLRRHILHHHRKEYAFECPFCDKAFIRTCILREHIKRVHKQETLNDSSVNSNSSKDSNKTGTSECPNIEDTSASEAIDNTIEDSTTTENEPLALIETNAVTSVEAELRPVPKLKKRKRYISQKQKKITLKFAHTKKCPICLKKFQTITEVRQHVKFDHEHEATFTNLEKTSTSNNSRGSEITEAIDDEVFFFPGRIFSNADKSEARSPYGKWLKKVLELKRDSFTCECGKTHYSKKEYLLHLFMIHPEIYKLRRAELLPDTLS